MGNELVKIDEAKVQLLDKAAEECSAVLQQGGGAISHALGLAQAVTTLRQLLSDDIMQPLMALQGSRLGFKTDKQYPVDTIRDCAIEAMTKSARPVGNEFNVIAGNCYLTKEYFLRMLDARLGSGNWRFNHEVPRTASNDKVGAVVTTKIWWRDSAGEHEETVQHAVKGNSMATADMYLGKADRKCGCWLLSNITGQRFADGEVDSAIDVVPERPKVTVLGMPEAAQKTPSLCPNVVGENTHQAPPMPTPAEARAEQSELPMPDDDDDLDLGLEPVPEWAEQLRANASDQQIITWLKAGQVPIKDRNWWKDVPGATVKKIEGNIEGAIKRILSGPQTKE